MNRSVPIMFTGILLSVAPVSLISLSFPLQTVAKTPLTSILELQALQLRAQGSGGSQSGGTITAGGGSWSIPGYVPPPTLDAQPGGTGQAGGGKGECPDTNLPLVAFVPKTDRGVQGATIAERPTFWFYVPYTAANNFSARFTLQDKQGQVIYQTTRPLPQSSGIISISMPPTAPALQVNQTYRWTLQLGCGNPALSVSGWVQRVATPPAIAAKLKTLADPQKAVLLAENGFWFDTLTIIGEARRKEPQNAAITNAWVGLLTKGNLDLSSEYQSRLKDIASQPIVR